MSMQCVAWVDGGRSDQHIAVSGRQLIRKLLGKSEAGDGYFDNQMLWRAQACYARTLTEGRAVDFAGPPRSRVAHRIAQQL